MNVIKCGVYSRLATILLRSWSGAVSIRGRPLNVVRRLFEQIRYIQFAMWIAVDISTILTCTWGGVVLGSTTVDTSVGNSTEPKALERNHVIVDQGEICCNGQWWVYTVCWHMRHLSSVSGISCTSIETLRFCFLSERITCNVWESHVCDRKRQVTRRFHMFSTCESRSTRMRFTCVFPG